MADINALKSRRQAVIDRAKVQESVEESPLHKNHTDMKNRDGTAKTPHSERPIAIQIDDRVHIVGEDVSKIKTALTGWKPKLTQHDAAYANTCVTKMLSDNPSTDHIECGTQVWNGVLFALTQCGVLVVITDMAEDA